MRINPNERIDFMKATRKARFARISDSHRSFLRSRKLSGQYKLFFGDRKFRCINKIYSNVTNNWNFRPKIEISYHIKKLFSVILSALLTALIIPSASLTAGALSYNVSDYSELVSAIGNCTATTPIYLTDDIVLPLERNGGYDDLYLPSKTYNFYLNGNKLDLGAYTINCEGELNIFNGSSEIGEIIANDTVITLNGSNSSFHTSSGMEITSRNGDAVVSRITANKDIIIEGAAIKAPNGSAVFVGGYGNKLTLKGCKLYGKYGVTTDFSEAVYYKKYKVAEILLQSGLIDAEEKVLNNNTEDVGNSITTNFYNMVRFFIVAGSFSEDIFSAYPDISWRYPGVGVLSALPELIDYNGYKTIVPTITSDSELTDALNNGGVYALACDITVNSAKNADVDGKIFGNGYTIKADSSMNNMFIVENDNAGTLDIENAVLDGNNNVDCAYFNNCPLNASNTTTAFAIKNSTIKNFYPRNYSVVYTKGAQGLDLDEVVFTDNRASLSNSENGSAVYVSSDCSASVKNSVVNGLKNGLGITNEGNLTLTDTDVISTSGNAVDDKGGNLTINGGEFEAPEGKKAVSTTQDSSVTVNDGIFSTELYDYVAADKFMIREKDNTSDGKYVVKNDFSGLTDVEDSNEFGLSLTSYSNLQILGAQKKHAINNVDNSQQESNNPDKCLRFITTVNEGLIKGNNVEDYGYVVAKVSDRQPDSLYQSRLFDILGYKKWNGEKTLSCKGTYNNVVSDTNFGDPESSATTYKYVTLAVNNIEEGCSIAARFYVKTKDGKLHYGDYYRIVDNKTFPGIAASIESLNN